MKHLNEFINEGLIGDIIMELLRRGLNWIDKGIDLVADNIKTSVNSVWDIVKDSAKDSRNERIKEIYKDGDKEFLKSCNDQIFSKKTFDARQDAITEFIESMYGEPMEKLKGRNRDNATAIYVEFTYRNYLFTVNTKKTPKSDKDKATRLLESMKSDSKYSKYIEEIARKNNKK